MAKKISLDYFRAKGLLPFQAEFALSFVEDRNKPYRELVAPTGTGKMIMVVALIAHELEEDAQKRILVLAPTPVLSQWQSQLLTMGVACTPIIVDRKTYLELESSTPLSETPWPLPAIILMSMDLAKRDDMAINLSGTIWDLVVIDESHLLTGKRKTLFDRLKKSGAAPRALLLTTLAPQLEDDVVTRVRYQDVVDWNGRHLFISFEKKLISVYYHRTEEERIFLNELYEFARQLTGKWSYGKLQEINILRTASSSLYTTEKVLHRLHDIWRPMRNKIMHGVPLADEDVNRIPRQLSLLVEDVEIIDELPDGTTVKPHDFLAMYQKLELLLDQIEEIPSDSKLDALISYVTQRFKGKETHHLCIWSSFVNTVEYLSSNLREVAGEVYSLTSSLNLTDRQDRTKAFRENGGILITTDAASTGVNLEYVDECINYDLPLNTLVFEQRWGRFLRFGREREFRMVILIDESKALKSEEEFFKTLERSISSEPYLQ